MTDPIAPKSKATSLNQLPTPASASTPAPSATPTSSTGKFPQPDPATGRTYFASRGPAEGARLLESAASKKDKASSLQKQHRDPRFGAEYTPLEITFMSGNYRGQKLDVGLNIVELSESQSAEWADQKQNGIRIGSNFENISPRTFQFSLEFSSLNDDVRQLGEAIAHLQELTDKNWHPPLLRIKVGGTVITPAVCTNFEIKYDEPLPGGKGFRHAVASLQFKLLGGQGSPHQLAPPLLDTNTYLQQYVQDTSERDREKQGIAATTGMLLAKCLGTAGSAEAVAAIDNQSLDQEAEVLKLSPGVFLQLVAAGVIPKTTLAHPKVSEKLKRDLAFTLAKERPGMNPAFIRTMAESLISGDPSSLPPTFLMQIPGRNQTEFEQALGDYTAILQAMQEQDLEPDAEIFKRPTDSGSGTGKNTPTSAETILNSFSCGIAMRRAGGAALGVQRSQSDRDLVDALNRILTNPKTKDNDIRKALGIPDAPETVIRRIRDGGPYKSKDEFLKQMAVRREGLNGYVLLQNLDAREKANLATINRFLAKPNLSDDEIKKAFNLDKPEEIAAIRNGGKPFKDKAEFLQKLAKPGENPSQSKGMQAWEDFWVFSQAHPQEVANDPTLGSK